MDKFLLFFGLIIYFIRENYSKLIMLLIVLYIFVQIFGLIFFNKI